MENTMRIPISRTARLLPGGGHEIVEDKFADVTVTETIMRAFLALLGTTPEEVVSKVSAMQTGSKPGESASPCAHVPPNGPGARAQKD
ncbi:MAG: hypothetical protein FWC27_11880 [Firmicutes bacterium]|nr:hypothetical protein [Bacillota bacterium]